MNKPNMVEMTAHPKAKASLCNWAEYLGKTGIAFARDSPY